MLKRIGPSIDLLGTPYKLDFASDIILSIFTECPIMQITCRPLAVYI